MITPGGPSSRVPVLSGQGSIPLSFFFQFNFPFILKLKQQNQIVWLKQHSGKRKVESLLAKKQILKLEASLPPSDKIGAGLQGGQAQWTSGLVMVCRFTAKITFKVSVFIGKKKKEASKLRNHHKQTNSCPTSTPKCL